ncbi:hypothetical protein, partial [Streptomyces glaucescens]|uniref:hypothetical protein n=1 Tax=Streptomyces glaucescens TaxID=1907 RepID=UPI0030DCD046
MAVLLARRLTCGALHLHARRVARLRLLESLVLRRQSGELGRQFLRVHDGLVGAEEARHAVHELAADEAQRHRERVPGARLLGLLRLDLALGLLGALDLGVLPLRLRRLLRRLLRVLRGGVRPRLAPQGLRG